MNLQVRHLNSKQDDIDFKGNSYNNKNSMKNMLMNQKNMNSKEEWKEISALPISPRFSWHAANPHSPYVTASIVDSLFLLTLFFQ